MEVKGILNKVSEVSPYTSQYGTNNYQWGEMLVDGEPAEVRFTNQDYSTLVGRHVHFIDRSDQQNGIQIKKKSDGTEYASIGGGKGVELWVDEQACSKIACPAGGAQQQSPKAASTGGKKAWGASTAPTTTPTQGPGPRAQRPETCFADRVGYGSRAVILMHQALGLEAVPLQEFVKTELAAAVYNSSMYAYKDNVPLNNPVEQAAKVFGATPDRSDHTNEFGPDIDDCEPF